MGCASCCGTPEVPTRLKEATFNIPPPKKNKNHLIQRCANAKIHTTDPLDFIRGYENESLTPLEDALEPFRDSINQLYENMIKAKRKCNRLSKHNLTHDESAAIYIYTMRWGHDCLYDHLEKAWKLENKRLMKPWFKYLKLLKSALDKLPTVGKEVWQGAPHSETLLKILGSRSSSMYSSMGLCLPTYVQIGDFLQENSNDKYILLSYNVEGVKSLYGYAATDGKVYFLWPGTKMGVSESYVEGGTGSVFYHLTKPSKYK